MRGTAEVKMVARSGAWPVLALASLVLAAPAAAVSCGGGAISARYSEAAQFCADGGGALPAPAQTAPRPPAPIIEDRPASVSVTMPGYATRLASARQEVREARSTIGAAPTGALVTAIAARYRINPRLLASIVRTESAGRMNAVSPKGALGLMQVMPGTAKGLGVRDPHAMLSNPELALSTGARYLKRLQTQFGNNPLLVVAAYNAGPGAVMKAGHRVPRFRETQGYVKSVMGGYQGQAR